MFKNKSKDEARLEILNAIKQYYDTFLIQPEYKDGDRINYAGRVFDAQEILNLSDSALEFWLTAGKYTHSVLKKS